MLALYIVLGLLAVIAAVVLLLLFVPVYGQVSYDDELHAQIRVLGIPITVLPKEELSKATPQKKKQSDGKPPKIKSLMREVSRSFHEDGVSATLSYLGKLAKTLSKAVGRLLHSVTVDNLELEMFVAGADASQTAVRYGEVCGVLYPSLAAISAPMRVRRREIRVEPNFLKDQSTVRFTVRFHVWVYRLVGAAIALLFQMMMIQDDTTEITTTDKEETNHGKS